jgi:hypothetical protein
VRRYSPGVHTERIDMAKSGVYFVKINTQGKAFTEKVVILK